MHAGVRLFWGDFEEFSRDVAFQAADLPFSLATLASLPVVSKKHKGVAKPLMVALSTIMIDELGAGPARGS